MLRVIEVHTRGWLRRSNVLQLTCGRKSEVARRAAERWRPVRPAWAQNWK